MTAIKKQVGKAKFGPIEWDQRIKAIQGEINAIGDDLSEKRTAADRARGQLSHAERELDFYVGERPRNSTRILPPGHKEDRARIEMDVRRGKVAVEFAEKALQPLQDQHDAMQEELSELIANPPAVTKADLKKSYGAVTELEQKLAKLKAARDCAVANTDDRPMQTLTAELEQVKSAYELAASGVHLGEATQADVDKAAQQLKDVRAKIGAAEDAAASQKAAVSGYGRRIEAIEAELQQANETHRIMVGLYGEAIQEEAVERVNQAIESIKAGLVEVAQADQLMRRFKAGNSLVGGLIELDIECGKFTHLHGLNTGRIRPDGDEVGEGVRKLLASIGYPIQPEDE